MIAHNYIQGRVIVDLAKRVTKFAPSNSVFIWRPKVPKVPKAS